MSFIKKRRKGDIVLFRGRVGQSPEGETKLTEPPTDVRANGAMVRDYAAYGQNSCAEPDWCSGTDFNKNGTVDFIDLSIFAEYWLEGTSP